MIETKLATLRFKLDSMDLTRSEVDFFIDRARSEISETVNSIVENAVSTVVSEAEGKGADEFLKQIKLDSGTGDIQINTDSGMLDFSEPPTPMLPWLLRNAKTSSDGSMYKVIPIGKESNKPAKVIKDTSAGLKAMRENTSMEDVARGIAAAFNSGAAPIVKEQERSKGSTGKQEFRTASSKQDPSSSWVLPPKDRDLSAVVLEANARIRSDVQLAVDSIMFKYLREAEDVVRNR